MLRAQNENTQELALHEEAQVRDVCPGSGLFQVLLRQKQKFLPSDQYCPSLLKGTRRPKALVKNRSPGEATHSLHPVNPETLLAAVLAASDAHQRTGLLLGSLARKTC